MLTSIGLYLDRRDLSLSFIEPSMYESNTKSSLLAVLLKADIHLANAVHRSLNVLNLRKPLFFWIYTVFASYNFQIHTVANIYACSYCDKTILHQTLNIRLASRTP
ncbi:hypothetical protein DPMN_105586 [Dreissena polymorpha]|uniref:Uncharacterized protein n=1 Tax=Dreissena polymorpha TaxID=45954 RepID=A0A9D4QHV1_DREPO|nr:hypothetical protein DPMN_105586 [Dreissena polymorpha]